VLREGEVSAYAAHRQIEVFTSQEDFETAYDLSGSEISPPPIPVVDFSNSLVIGLFLHELPSMGEQSIGVKSITKNSLATTVNIELVKLKEGCPSDSAISQPYQFISMQKTDVPMVFKETLVEKACE